MVSMIILGIVLFIMAILSLVSLMKILREKWNRKKPEKIKSFSAEQFPKDNMNEILGLKNEKMDFAEEKEKFQKKSSSSESSAYKENFDSAKASSSSNTSVIALYVMANSAHPYRGYELLQTLLSVGLRYGSMNIFHRHEHATGLGEILFSVASIAKPGTFDLQNMGAFSSPGLALFMVLSKVKDPLDVLDIMIDTGNQLAEDLGGVVLDDEKNPLSRLLHPQKWVLI